MPQISLFFTMLIAASEAFLIGSHISTSNKRKISGFVPNVRILKSANPVFGNMDFPVKIDTKPGMVLPREESTLSLCTRYKRFSNDSRTSLKQLDNVGFLRNRKFFNRGRRNSSRRLRSMRRKRKLASSFPATRTMNGNSYPGSENSSVPSVISIFDSPVNSNMFYGKAVYPNSRSKVIKKKQIKDLNYLPFNSKQLLKYSNLRAKRKDFKRHRRIESRPVKKYKRDAETENVSQANVTKDVKEKDLDEESSDGLDDSYLQDLRPEFATQHLDGTSSNWRKYLELNRTPVSPYLLPSMSDDTDHYDSVSDIPPPFEYVPEMNFRIPYDRKTYEDTHFEGEDSDAKFFRKTESDDVMEKGKQKKKKKKKEKKSESSHLVKLKHVLENVENALKEENDSSNSVMSGKDHNSDGNQGNSEEAMRTKIDVIMSLLSQISQELGKRSIQLQRTTEERKSNVSEEEGKEVKQNGKQISDCSLDGIWLSNIMGLEINLSTQPNLMLKVAMKSFKKDTLIDGNWSIHGLTLAKTEGPFVLAAIHPGKKKIASFIGQCWVCEEQDYVYGSWTIFTGVEKITDLLTAVETKMDVLTRKKDKDEVT